MLRFSNFLIFAIAGTIMLVSACGGSDLEQVQVSSVLSDDFQTYPVDIESADVPFSEMVDEVELMMLEETDSSLLSYVFRVSEVEGKYIFPGDNEGNIYVFSSRGKFLNKFNRRGDGPGEYSSISTLWMEGDLIVLHDEQKQKIHWYDHEGNHQKEIKLPEAASHVYPYDDGYVLDMSLAPIADSLKYNVLTVDGELKTKEFLLPYEEGMPFPISSSVNTFGRFNNKLIYKTIFADTVFFIESNGTKPFLQIDFGDKYLWNDKSLYENGSAAMQAIPEGRGVWIFHPHIGPKHIFMTYNTSFEDFGMMLIERESGNHYRVNINKKLEEKYNLGTITWMGDRLLFSISSDDVGDFLEELDESQWEFREGTTLEKIESSENPVMMWVRFKNAIQ